MSLLEYHVFHVFELLLVRVHIAVWGLGLQGSLLFAEVKDLLVVGHTALSVAHLRHDVALGVPVGQRKSGLRVVAELALDGGFALRGASLFGPTLEGLIVAFVVQLPEGVCQLV